MKFNDKELEELITYAEQVKVLVPRIPYTNEYVDKLLNQQKEFISYLENEKDRLSRECSQIYEDSLGKTRLVNEDIFNEVNDILQKYKSIIGVLDEKSNNISS